MGQIVWRMSRRFLRSPRDGGFSMVIKGSSPLGHLGPSKGDAVRLEAILLMLGCSRLVSYSLVVIYYHFTILTQSFIVIALSVTLRWMRTKNLSCIFLLR